jgi:branched-chain amino acid transport system substrate-binding protein
MNTKRFLVQAGALVALAAYAALATGPARANDQLPVKIGVLGDYTSVYSSVGGEALLEAVKMAVEDAGGTILGKPIEVVSADTQLKPDIASTTARQWFDQDNVDVIVDLPSTAMTLAVADLAKERKKIVLATSAASSIITGANCSPYVAHWTYDTYSNAKSISNALINEGGTKWFVLSQDSVTGTATEADLSKFITEFNGEIVGKVRAPVDASDYSSFLLQAQASGANVLAILPAGAAGVTAVKQAAEFGLPQSGMKMMSFFMMPDDVRAIGLDGAQGLYLTTAFVWDRSEETSEFSNRFLERTGKKPNMNMAGSYSAVRNYLAAVEAAGTKEADAVMAKMRDTPIKDVFTDAGTLRVDGRMQHSMFVVQVKKPDESSGEWDLFNLVQEVPADVATRPLAEGGCSLVK